MTHQSAAKSVKELIASGAVRAEPHTSDGRKLLVHLTGTGRARLREERGQRAAWLNTAIRDALDRDERRQLRDCVPLLARLTTRITGP